MSREEKIAIQKKEMTRLMDYFKNNQLDFNDTQLLQKMQSSITRIFQVEIEELGYRYDPSKDDSQNTFRLEFINDREKTFRGSHSLSGSKPLIKYNIALLYADLQSSAVDKRLFACKTLFKSVFHEIQHHRQYLMAKANVSSKDGITYARDFALKILLKGEWYSRNENTGNYDAYALENNANEVGYRQYLETMGLPDEKITDLWHIEQGKFSIERYKADIEALDGEHYESGGLQERADVAIPILDDLICGKGKTEILKQFPILQKEYNLDGSKKSAIELIQNMQKELQTISQNSSFSDCDKKSLMRDSREMYYELIYRQIEKATPEQIAEIVSKVGKDESREIFQEMFHYFQFEMENRLGKSAMMSSALERQQGNYEFIMPSNTGTIEIKQNGKIIQVSFEDFIKTIDPKLLQKKFIIPAGESKGEMSAEQFVKRYFFRYLPQNGQVKLKDGTEISAKQYVEQYALQMGELRIDYAPNKFIKDTMKSESKWWNIHNETCQRLVQYYEGKKQVLADVEQKISSYDSPKADFGKGATEQQTAEIKETRRMSKDIHFDNEVQEAPMDFKTTLKEDIGRAGVDVGDVYRMTDTIQKDMQQDRSNGIDR